MKSPFCACVSADLSIHKRPMCAMCVCIRWSSLLYIYTCGCVFRCGVCLRVIYYITQHTTFWWKESRKALLCTQQQHTFYLSDVFRFEYRPYSAAAAAQGRCGWVLWPPSGALIRKNVSRNICEQRKKRGDCNTTFWNETISRWAACFLGFVYIFSPFFS
jgi:hypothetical protein